jgi:DHA1 family multidrug resistance protein-like MFS transporter
MRAATLDAWDAWSMNTAASALSQRSRVAIYLAIFLAFIDNFALLPVIGPRAEELGGTPLLVGIAIAAYSLANLAFDPIGGIIADRIGRRRVVVVALIISPIAIAIYAFADSLPLFLMARVIHGASGGVLSAALFALLGDAAPVGERGRTLGRAGALIGVAAVLGPASAALVSNLFGVNAVFLGVAGVIAIGLALVLPLLPETLIVTPATRRTIGVWHRILGEPRVRVALLAIFGLEAAVGSVTGFIKDGLIQRALDEGRTYEAALRYAAGASGGLFTIFGIIAIALMLSRISTRVDKRGPFGISLVGLAALVGALALLALSPTLTIDLVAMVLYGIGYGLIFPAAAGAIAIASAPEERGRANGAFNTAFDLGISAGPILGGLVATLAIGVTPFAGGLTLVVTTLLLLPFAARPAARGATGG